MTLKKILYRSILFLGLLISTDQLVGYILDKKYQSNLCNFANGEINEYIKYKSCDTLFIGSSRVLNMIDPAVLGPKTTNLGKQQKHNYYHTCIVDLLAKNNKLPKKTLILNLEVCDLFMENEPSLINQVNSLKYYYTSNELVQSFINKQGWQERLKFLSSSYRHNSSGLLLVTNSLEGVCLNYPSNGYFPLEPSVYDSIRLARSLMEDFDPIVNKRFNKTIFKNISFVKSTCDKNEIQLIIIEAPYYKVHPEYKMASIAIEKYCLKKNIRFIDFKYEKIPGLENKNNWYDNMHTNKNGTKIYNQYSKQKIYQ